VRHLLTTAFTYDLPSVNAGAVGNAALRHWSVDAIFTARSATPVNVVVNRDIGFGSFNFRPDLVQDVPLYLDDPAVGGGKKINPAAFSAPREARQGTLGRNSLRGFAVAQLDLAVRRQFGLTERLKLQFKAELFNALNHPNFGDPSGVLGVVSANGTLTLSSFGISSAMLSRSLGTGGQNGGLNPLYQIGGPRSVQFSARLQF
jgi:hypothetical protein